MKTLKNELPHWLILAVPFIYLALVYPKLPGIIPTHFDGIGTPNDYRHKSTLLWTIPLLTIVIYVIMLLVSKITPRKQITYLPKLINRLRLALTSIFSALAMVIIYISQPSVNVRLGIYIILAAVLLLLTAIAVFLYFFYKKIYLNPDSGLSQDTKYFYKWGIFYYNPNDKRLWVPKLSGLGWTLNFASPFAYLIMAAIIGFIIFSTRR